eukprot:COSAG01_NODE_432_length_17115_cov_126.732593_15_plen_174_part_00
MVRLAATSQRRGREQRIEATPPLKAIEPPPSAPPTPRRYAGGRREARPTHPSLVADGRHPPRERRAGTPSRGGAILGSLCPPNRQMACLSSSYYTARQRNFLLLTDGSPAPAPPPPPRAPAEPPPPPLQRQLPALQPGPPHQQPGAQSPHSHRAIENQSLVYREYGISSTRTG